MSAGMGGPSSPSSRKDSSPSAAMQQTLTSFCPPEGLWLYREEQGCPGPVFFSTVLWGLSRRAYVCCLMVWEPRAWPWDIDHGEMQRSGLIDGMVAVTEDGLDEADLEDYSRDSPAGASIVYVPTCLCFMTRQPLISSLKSVLYELYQLQQRTAKVSFLRQLLKTPTRPARRVTTLLLLLRAPSAVSSATLAVLDWPGRQSSCTSASVTHTCGR
uniref:uDENN domain-containing protein n=1 Tax=Vitrella brassicaformis TaxID=1169539 RepID=A0A7S1KB96_9ALVE|mmetsp:Transcript_46532/g.115842  ORF Transcript_46532/g.115842 Transcript_46532/m.115842 type:complete len:214 (+) Transcript_46532:748-1389(+)